MTSIFKPGKKKIIVLVVLIIAAVFIFNYFNKPRAEVLQFTQAKKQDIKSTISSSGTLTGKNVVDLKFKSSGKLAYLNVKAGDSVYKGQVIAGLDTQQLSIDLQQAQNTLRDKQALVDKALDEVKDNSDDESFTQKVTRTTAEVAKDNAFDSVKEAQRAFQDAIIISPIAGLITFTNYIPGQIIGSEAVTQVVDFSSFYFDTDIDEADIGKIALGQKAIVTLDAYLNREFEGKVAEIIPQTSSTSSGATVVKVRINLGNPDISPINGLSGQASIIFAEAKNVLIIPLESLRDDNTVVVQSQNGLKPKTVETGIKSDTDAEIKTGISEEDEILLNPPANRGLLRQNRNPIQSAIFRVFGGSRRQ